MFKSILLLGILFFFFWEVIVRILTAPIDYDEGFNLQVSRNIKELYSYSTYEMDFDPRITTGPTVLIPASLLINKHFPLLPRLTIFIFSFFLIYFSIKKFLLSFYQIIFYIVLLFFTPLIFFFTSHILGEIPAFFFYILSIHFLSIRKYSICGLCIGLCILTKSIFILGLIPIIVFILLKHRGSLLVQRTSLILISFGGVFLSWEIYKIVCVNYDFMKYTNILIASNNYYGLKGTPQSILFPHRLNMIEYVFSVNPYIFLLIAIYSSIYLLVKRKVSEKIKILSLFYLVYSAYFLFLGTSNWYRHFFPAVLSLAMILPVFLELFIKNITKEKVIFLFTFLILIGLNLYHQSFKNTHEVSMQKKIEQNLIFQEDYFYLLPRKSNLLIAQLETANYINAHISSKESISGIGWWNAPEISYLTNRSIERDPFSEKNIFLISHIFGQFLDKESDTIINHMPSTQKVFETMGYKIYQRN